jgi:hypothetical protein
MYALNAQRAVHTDNYIPIANSKEGGFKASK